MAVNKILARPPICQFDSQLRNSEKSTRNQWLRAGVASIALIAVLQWHFAGSWTSRLGDANSLTQTQQAEDIKDGGSILTEPWSKVRITLLCL